MADQTEDPNVFETANAGFAQAIYEDYLRDPALVAPEWRNRGVGTALIVRSGNRLAARGATEWTLAVTVGNPAQRLYERLGFRVDRSLLTMNHEIGPST